MSDRWRKKRGRKLGKGHRSVTCCLWKQFTPREWAGGWKGSGKRETNGANIEPKENQFSATETQRRFHLIDTLRNKNRRREGTDEARSCGQHPVKVKQWHPPAFCLKAFLSLPLFTSLWLTLILILKISLLINSWQCPRWHAFTRNLAELYTFSRV